ncbi:hypothetical protein C8Q74DRAFT_651121 [Fomes fomentarius]|nr:hypothetical protein C8Q74DRAFT_651121 [Fomes fomentarius]
MQPYLLNWPSGSFSSPVTTSSLPGHEHFYCIVDSDQTHADPPPTSHPIPSLRLYCMPNGPGHACSLSLPPRPVHLRVSVDAMIIVVCCWTILLHPPDALAWACLILRVRRQSISQTPAPHHSASRFLPFDTIASSMLGTLGCNTTPAQMPFIRALHSCTVPRARWTCGFAHYGLVYRYPFLGSFSACDSLARAVYIPVAIFFLCVRVQVGNSRGRIYKHSRPSFAVVVGDRNVQIQIYVYIAFAYYAHGGGGFSGSRLELVFGSSC